MNMRGNISLALIGVACLFGVGIFGWLIRSWAVTHNLARAQGHVIELIQRHYDDGVDYCPIFAFKDASGTEHTIQSLVGSNPPRFPIGSKVSILYRAENPTDAQIEDRLLLWVIPFILLGLCMLFGTIGYIIGKGKKIQNVAHNFY